MNIKRLEEELKILNGISSIVSSNDKYPILIEVFGKFGLINLANIEKKAYHIYKNDNERFGNNNLYEEKTFHYEIEKKNVKNKKSVDNYDDDDDDDDKSKTNRTCFYIDDHFKLARLWFQETPRSWFDDVPIEINIIRTEAPPPPPPSYPPPPPLNLSYYKRIPKEGNPFGNSKYNPYRLNSKLLSNNVVSPTTSKGGISKIYTSDCNVGTEGKGDETELLFRKFVEEYMSRPDLRKIVSILEGEVEKFKHIFFQNDGILEYNNIDWLSSPLSKVLEFIKKDIEDISELGKLYKKKELTLPLKQKSLSLKNTLFKDSKKFRSIILQKRQSGGCYKYKKTVHKRRYSRRKKNRPLKNLRP